MAEEQKSLTWVIAVLMGGVLVFGWGFLAGSYAGAHAKPYSEFSEAEREAFDGSDLNRAQRGSLSGFIKTGIAQLPNLPAVIGWHFSNRIWLPIWILVVEAGVFCGGLALKRMEKQLEQPRRRR
jgi:hypothetical protein